MIAIDISLTAVLTIAIIIGIWALLSLGLNFHWGDTGLLNFAHVGFYAIGAYTSTLLTVPASGSLANRTIGFDMPIVVGLAGGTVLAAVAGVLFALPSKKLDGDYFAIVTLAFAELLRIMLTNEDWLTEGVNGITGIPRPLSETIQGGPNTYELFYLGLVVVILGACYLVLHRLTSSPFGRVLHAIREDEQVPRALGKETYLAKLKSFGIGAGIAGLAGGLWAHFAYAITPSQFNPNFTFIIWTAIILGGVGSHGGAIVGTIVIVTIREMTRLLPSDIPFASDIEYLRVILIGVLLIAVLYYRPHGIMGDKERLAAGTTSGGSD